MEAKNLRIGNWVRTVYPTNKEPFQVWPISFKQMPTDKKHNLALDTWEGIPLTDGWLQKFGFVHKKDNCWHIKVDGFWCSFNLYKPEKFDGYLVSWAYNDTESITLRDIRYVHELQNLFFALTGTELELKTESSTCS